MYSPYFIFFFSLIDVIQVVFSFKNTPTALASANRTFSSKPPHPDNKNHNVKIQQQNIKHI